MARSRCWGVMVSGIAGMATVSSQRRQPSLLSGAQSRLNTPVEHHGAHESLRIDPALARAQGPAERAVKAEILPKLMQGEDIAKGSRRLVGDPGLGYLLATRRSAEPPDEGIEMAILHPIDAPEIGDDAQPGFAGLIAIGLHDRQVAASAALGGAHKHGM